MKKFTLYYDGRCSLCSREIALLRRISPESSGFTDIHEISDFSDFPDKQTMLRVLHLRCDSGQWFQGLDATIKIWGQTRYGFLFKILNIPGIRHVSQLAYRRWADKRYCRLYAECGIANS